MVSKQEQDIEVSREARDWDGVFDKLQKYKKRLPENVPLELIYRGERELDESRHDPSAASNFARQALGKCPDSMEASVVLARAELDRGGFESAIAVLSRVLSATSSSATTSSARSLRFSLGGFAVQAESFERLGDLNKALESNHDLVEAGLRGFTIFGQSALSRPAFDRALLRFPTLLLSRGDTAEAVLSLRRALAPPATRFASAQARLRALRMLFDVDTFFCSGGCPWPSYPESLTLPKSPQEEASMVLEVLERDTEGSDQRTYDDSVLLYGISALPHMSVWALERAVSVRPTDPLPWRQLAYALASCRRSRNALCICDQILSGAGDASAASPETDSILHLAAMLSLDHLDNPRGCIEYCQRALGRAGPQPLAPRFHLLTGVAAGRLAIGEKVERERLRLHKLALGSLHRSVARDAADHSANHFLALAYADLREIDLALLYEQRALSVNPGSGDSWNALALLFSAKKWNLAALQAAEAGLRRCPDHMGLLMTQAELELAAGLPAQSARTCLTATTRWRATLDAMPAAPGDPGGEDDKHSVVSFRSTSVPLVAATPTPTLDQQQQPFLPTELCIVLSKSFAALKQWEDARSVLAEQLIVAGAAGDKTAVASVLNMQGQLAVQTAEDVASSLFEKALSVDPAHVESLLAMSSLARAAGQPVLEEAHVLSVLSTSPLCHQAWFSMGTILKEKGSTTLATECFLAAARLEETAPVRPFSSIPRTISLS